MTSIVSSQPARPKSFDRGVLLKSWCITWIMVYYLDRGVLLGKQNGDKQISCLFGFCVKILPTSLCDFEESDSNFVVSQYVGLIRITPQATHACAYMA